jgi:hypothetical protein
MNRTTKAYLCVTLGLGLALAALGLSRWQSTDLPVYAVCLLLTILVSTFKVKLPGLDGTYSLNFIFLLVSVAEFTLAEAMLLACAAAIVQSLWRRKNRPTAVQIGFNVACLIITVTACYGVNQLVFQAFGSKLIALLFVAVVYFVVNTCLVAGIMAMMAGERILAVWRQWFLWSFPYYVVGAGIAWAASMSGGHLSTRILGASLPFLYLMYSYYREILERRADAR